MIYFDLWILVIWRSQILFSFNHYILIILSIISLTFGTSGFNRGLKPHFITFRFRRNRPFTGGEMIWKWYNDSTGFFLEAVVACQGFERRKMKQIARKLRDDRLGFLNSTILDGFRPWNTEVIPKTESGGAKTYRGSLNRAGWPKIDRDSFLKPDPNGWLAVQPA